MHERDERQALGRAERPTAAFDAEAKEMRSARDDGMRKAISRA